MLFLGAGASKPFGIPRMSGDDGLSEKFEKEVIENNSELTKGEKEVYLDIKNALSINNLEDILTVLNDLSEELRNPSISYFKFNLDLYFKKCEELDQYIENGRIIKCWREPRETENAMIYPMREKEVFKELKQKLSEVEMKWN